jgi:hypothetical protein
MEDIVAGAKDMDDLMNKAQEKGMFLVDHENIGPLVAEFEQTMKDAEKLMEVVDDDRTPYDSKYKARASLDEIVKKMEATRAIASLEKKKDLMQSLDVKLASARVKIGSISWEVDEPHNAQQELEMACEYYFPQLVDQIDTIVGPTTNDSDEGGVDEKTDDLVPPPLNKLPVNVIQDAMLNLNLLGILWAGRGQVRKSFLYLLSANTFYETNIADKLKDTAVGPALPTVVLTGIESTYTHNLFYLAQAYGNIGNVTLSSKYCRMTLERQYATVFKLDGEVKTDLEWVKNCGGMAAFFVAMRQYNNAALALSTAEKTLHERVAPRIIALTEAANADMNTDSKAKTKTSPGYLADIQRLSAEVQADINRRYVTLDVLVLRRSCQMYKDAIASAELGVDWDPAQYEGDTNSDDDFSPIQRVMPPLPPPGLDPTDTTSISEESPMLALTEFISGIPVQPTTHLTQAISSFDVAREVFLRAGSRLEAAKKHFVLDGCVTDHVTLLCEHSKLYHYLAAFETETKRKLAMEQRRLTMLSPLLLSLSRSAYEALHKQIAYELGECALAMLDLKLDKLRSKDPNGEIIEQKLKKSEIVNCNEYCKIGLAMFAHFTQMYAPTTANITSSERPAAAASYWADMEKMQNHQVATSACLAPDEAQISAEEVRPFLNAHFLSCRLMSKTIPTADYCPKEDRTFFMQQCLKRYEWIAIFAPKLCTSKGVDISECFSEELGICKDMVNLLPSKIDRMRYKGESGLSL